MKKLSKLNVSLICLTCLLFLNVTKASNVPAMRDAGKGKTAFAGVTYYVDNNGSDNNNGTSVTTPWKTLAKVSSTMFNPGDQILLKRGGVWYGQLKVSSSGSANAPIHFGAYGSGDLPVITGFTSLTQWESAGNGIWQSNCNSCTTGLNMAVMDDKVLAIGRYPNANAANGGYLKIDSHNGATSITDNSLSGNWTGAEVVIRQNRWIIDRNPIIRQSGNTIYYKATSNYSPDDQNGYFIQNSVKTLDQSGEWFFNSGTKMFMIYTGGAKPAGEVKVSSIDKLVSFDNRQYITFDRISFQGANVNAFTISRSQNITIRNCEILYTGGDAIHAPSVNNMLVRSNRIENSLNTAFVSFGCTNSRVSNNTIKNTGMITGMGKSDDNTYEGIVIVGGSNVVDSNRVDNTGYIGIKFGGDSVLIKNNIINNFTLVKSDGGGIYTVAQKVNVNRKVIGNIITNGKGYGIGTNEPDFLIGAGIYTDDKSANVSIEDNTSTNNCMGIYILNANTITVKNNVVFNNNSQLFIRHSNGASKGLVRRLLISNNIFASNLGGKNSMVDLNNVDHDDFDQIGKFDSNLYAVSQQTTPMMNVLVGAGSRKVATNGLNILQLKTKYRNDQNSKNIVSSSLRLECNQSREPKTVKLDGSYKDLKSNNVYNNTITLQPYQSAVLAKQ